MSAARSERKADDPRVVAAGQGGDEAVAAEEVGGAVDREEEAQVAQVPELVEGPGVGGESGPGGGQARLELPDARDGGVELGPRALQGDLDLGELLGAQAQLELQLLHLAEQALLLAAQAGELLLQGGAPLLDLAQPLPSSAGGGRRGERPPPAPPAAPRRGRAAGGRRLTRGSCRRSRPGAASSSFRTVGARSMMCGAGFAILRLQKKTPSLISVAVAQWSPLHFLLLFSTTARRMPPSVSCQPTR